MPEGHTVHRLARLLGGDLGDQVVGASSPQGRFSSGAAVIDGARAEKMWAHRKHLFVAFDQRRSPVRLHVQSSCSAPASTLVVRLVR